MLTYFMDGPLSSWGTSMLPLCSSLGKLFWFWSFDSALGNQFYLIWRNAVPPPLFGDENNTRNKYHDENGRVGFTKKKPRQKCIYLVTSVLLIDDHPVVKPSHLHFIQTRLKLVKWILKILTFPLLYHTIIILFNWIYLNCAIFYSQVWRTEKRRVWI